VHVDELATPALFIDLAAFEHNVATMTEAWPGRSLRPHVKAFKSTALAARLAAAGHPGFCCATIREMEGMAAAGLGDDLLLANEVVDARRLGALVEQGLARVTVAVDSPETVAAAADGGVREVLIDVNVGLPRCGCDPDEAAALADLARQRGLEVRGVMGYEGHLVGLDDREQRVAGVATSMADLLRAHDAVGGDVVSGGGTGTWDINHSITELQAGSYLLMDTAYAKLDLPFRQALFLRATVVSVNRGAGYAVGDVGLKSLGMDHGNPRVVDASVWFCSDEHITFAPKGDASLPSVGDRVTVVPAHVDPTVAYHDRFHIVRNGQVVDEWPIDLRGW
jgi:D-serine deaminase-like pyridoxal phosphate-dependent protein